MDARNAIELLGWFFVMPAGISVALLFFLRRWLPERYAAGCGVAIATLAGEVYQPLRLGGTAAPRSSDACDRNRHVRSAAVQGTSDHGCRDFRRNRAMRGDQCHVDIQHACLRVVRVCNEAAVNNSR